MASCLFLHATTVTVNAQYYSCLLSLKSFPTVNLGSYYWLASYPWGNEEAVSFQLLLHWVPMARHLLEWGHCYTLGNVWSHSFRSTWLGSKSDEVWVQDGPVPFSLVQQISEKNGQEVFSWMVQTLEKDGGAQRICLWHFFHIMGLGIIRPAVIMLFVSFWILCLKLDRLHWERLVMSLWLGLQGSPTSMFKGGMHSDPSLCFLK